MTKDEKAWVAFLHDHGCAVCRSPADIHHVSRKSHLETISLCPRHHRLGENNKQFVSIHPWKREFERRYGNETEILERLRSIYGLREDAQGQDH